MYPDQLAELISKAVNDTSNGKLYNYRYNIMPTITEVDEIDEDRQTVTNVLGQTIFDEANPHYARLALDCYKELDYKLAPFGKDKVVLMLTGANATAIHIAAMKSPYKDLFPYSDLDLKIMINPNMGRDYNVIRSRVTIIVNQVLSTHKRRLDRMFFKRRDHDHETNYFFDDTTKDKFKETFADNLKAKNASIKPCFADDATRNRCSTNSYMIVPSFGKKGSSVMIEMHHFKQAERIPLAYTPIFVSLNNTINVTDSETKRTISFSLYRIRMKHIVELESDRIKINLRYHGNNKDRVEVQFFTPYEKVSADFVDVSIPNTNDTELIDFAECGGFEGNLTQSVNAFGFCLTLPTINECKLEYHKMLYVYKCPDSKRAKRELKYAALQAATSPIPPQAKTLFAAKMKHDLKKKAANVAVVEAVTPTKIHVIDCSKQLVMV